ncbi:MAG: hypothetical protein WC223_03505 [Bacteroidales bacterium]|jgi:hypothetical protein
MKKKSLILSAFFVLTTYVYSQTTVTTTGGTGTSSAGYIPRFSGTSTIINSALYQTSAGKVGIGTGTSISGTLHVKATSNMSALFDAATEGFFEIRPRLNSNGGIQLAYGLADLVFGNETYIGGSGFAERMRITTDGNIGIGTPTISNSRLTLQGATSDNTANALNINNSSGTNLVTFRNDGKIGIGINDPVAKLHFRVTMEDFRNKVIMIHNGRGVVGGYDWGYSPTFIVNAGGQVYSTSYFIPGSTGSMENNDCSYYFCANGNGIFGKGIYITDGEYTSQSGNTTGSINFKVKPDGSVYARSVNVQTGTFPDFVFEKNYNLMNLTELEKYVTKNKHLPNVPTANEVKDNGMDLGKINTTLLQKVEELTLYVIEQNKQMNDMKKEIDELKKQIENK